MSLSPAAVAGSTTFRGGPASGARRDGPLSRGLSGAPGAGGSGPSSDLEEDEGEENQAARDKQEGPRQTGELDSILDELDCTAVLCSVLEKRHGSVFNGWLEALDVDRDGRVDYEQFFVQITKSETFGVKASVAEIPHRAVGTDASAFRAPKHWALQWT